MYPTKRAISEHKDKVYQMLLLYFIDMVPIENVDASLRSLAGDAVIYANNTRQHTEFNLEKAKQRLLKLKVVEEKE